MKANSVFPVLHSLTMGMQNRVHDARKQDTKGRYAMRYYFKLSDSSEREEAILQGEEPKPIKLYPETQTIKADFEENPVSDWWPVWRFGTYSTDAGDFQTEAEAVAEYGYNEAETIYCIVHDC